MKHTNKLKLWCFFVALVISFVTTPAIAQKKINAGSTGDKYETGVIHRMDTDEIVINDVLYKFSKDVKFLSRQEKKIETRWFKEGDKVKFKINLQNDTEVTIVRKT